LDNIEAFPTRETKGKKENDDVEASRKLRGHQQMEEEGVDESQ
jgi:hypothetical protein